MYLFRSLLFFLVLEKNGIFLGNHRPKNDTGSSEAVTLHCFQYSGLQFWVKISCLKGITLKFIWAFLSKKMGTEHFTFNFIEQFASLSTELPNNHFYKEKHVTQYKLIVPSTWFLLNVFIETTKGWVLYKDIVDRKESLSQCQTRFQSAINSSVVNNIGKDV